MNCWGLFFPPNINTLPVLWSWPIAAEEVDLGKVVLHRMKLALPCHADNGKMENMINIDSVEAMYLFIDIIHLLYKIYESYIPSVDIMTSSF